MFFTSERMVPAKARAWREGERGAKVSTPSSDFTSISAASASVSEPLAPFTITRPPSRRTSTPFGTGTGAFAMRDISCVPLAS